MNKKIQKFIVQVIQRCKQNHIRLTPQRLAVLKLISQYNEHNEAAISAYNLLHLLRQSYSPHAKPSTIYRALNFLLQQRFIHRIESTNSFMICHHFLELSHNFSFFICQRCNKVTEHTTKGIEEILQKTAKITGFIMLDKIIEAHGLCIKCTKINKNSYYISLKNIKN